MEAIMNIKRFSAFLLGFSLLGGSAFASSPWPTSIVGTWNMSANQSTLTLTIQHQSGSGPCKAITGTLVDTVNGTADVNGYYCNNSGRISFLREDPSSLETYQVFTGNLSYPGSPTYMSGVFDQEIGVTPGEYDFFASSAGN
jgi:hypothetical protein